MSRGDSRHTTTSPTATPATHTVSARNTGSAQENATPGTPDTPGADTTALGYDTQWATLRACDTGAPHRRARLFLLAVRPGRAGRLPAAAHLDVAAAHPDRH